MASVSTINPISPYNYQQYGGQTGVGDALTGASGLAQALAGNPAAQAQSAYLGAETGNVQAKTRSLNTDATDRATIAGILGNPQASTADLQRALGLAAANPNMAAQVPGMINNFVQFGIMTGRQGGPSQAQADTYAAGSGAVPIGNTATGQGRELTSQEKRTGMSAGATVAAANIAANASMTNERVAQGATTSRTVGTYKDAAGNIITMPTAEAGRTHAPAYDSAAAVEAQRETGLNLRNPISTIPPGAPIGTSPVLTAPSAAVGQQPYQPQAALEASKPTPVMKNGVPSIVRTDQAAAPGNAPVPNGTDQSLGILMAQPGGAPGSQTAGPGAPPGPSTAINWDRVRSGRPEGPAEMAAAKALNYNVQPPQAQAGDLKDAAKVTAAISRAITAALVPPEQRSGAFPVALGKDGAAIAPDVMAAVTSLKDQYERGLIPNQDQALRANPEGALNQAVLDLKGSLSVRKSHGILPNAVGGGPTVIGFNPDYTRPGQGAAPAPGAPGAAPAGSPSPGQPGQGLYVVGQPAGLTAPGNLDLNKRPIVKNPDGSISTVRTMGIGVDGRQVLIPTVVGGKVVTNEQAIEHYRQTGENLGTFDTPENANAYAELLHQAQAQQYAPPSGVAPTLAGTNQAALTPPPSAAPTQAAAPAPAPTAAPPAAASSGVAAALGGANASPAPAPAPAPAANQPPPAEANQPPGAAPATGPTPQAVARATANPNMAIQEARALVTRNPAMAQVAVQRLRMANVPVPADLLKAAGLDPGPAPSAPTNE